MFRGDGDGEKTEVTDTIRGEKIGGQEKHPARDTIQG